MYRLDLYNNPMTSQNSLKDRCSSPGAVGQQVMLRVSMQGRGERQIRKVGLTVNVGFGKSHRECRQQAGLLAQQADKWVFVAHSLYLGMCVCRKSDKV